MQSSCRLDERARPEIVRNILGHVDIRMTRNVYGKSWWEERVDAATQAVEPVTNAPKMPRGRRAPALGIGVPVDAPEQGKSGGPELSREHPSIYRDRGASHVRRICRSDKGDHTSNLLRRCQTLGRYG
jgi:hypothetical protein